MKTETLKKAIELGKEVGNSFIATADESGVPHLASASEIQIERENLLALSEWFCPGTAANLQVNPHVSVVIWDAEKDHGYQLIGKFQRRKDLAVMDGYSAGSDEQTAMPQVRSKLLIQVEKIIDFSHAPHSDVEV